MRLDKNTYGTVLLVYVLSVVLAILLFRFVQTAWLVWPLAALLLCFCLWQTYFHMVPDRTGAGSSSLVSSVADGKDVFFKQLAGGFARRIVCYAREGLDVTAGEQCGIIKFGSRIDIYLPLDAEILVEKGQYVRACETIIARL